MFLLFKRFPCFLILLCVGVVASSPALYAQSSRDISNRLDRMEREINTLSRAVYRGESPPKATGSSGDAGTAQADAEIRLQQLEMELRNLTGQIEEQSYQIRQLQAQLEKTVSDLELRVQDLEAGKRKTVSASPGTATGSATGYPTPSARSQAGTLNYQGRTLPPSTTSSPQSIQPSTGQLGTIAQPPRNNAADTDRAASAYENAFALLKRSSFDAAESEFRQFLEQYPDHVLASNARYWYGETFYVRGDYERAARIFSESYQKDPNGAKAPDNLLKLGMSLAGMGNNDDACVALRQLVKENASRTTPVLRRAQQEMTRLGC